MAWRIRKISGSHATIATYAIEKDGESIGRIDDTGVTIPPRFHVSLAVHTSFNFSVATMAEAVAWVRGVETAVQVFGSEMKAAGF